MKMNCMNSEGDVTLTPSLPRCHLKTTSKSAKIWNPQPFRSSFSRWHVKGFSSKRTALKVDVLQDRKIYCSQARPCIFQPGNFTGWGSEGVKLCFAELVFALVGALRADWGKYQLPTASSLLLTPIKYWTSDQSKKKEQLGGGGGGAAAALLAEAQQLSQHLVIKICLYERSQTMSSPLRAGKQSGPSQPSTPTPTYHWISKSTHTQYGKWLVFISVLSVRLFPPPV